MILFHQILNHSIRIAINITATIIIPKLTASILENVDALYTIATALLPVLK